MKKVIYFSICLLFTNLIFGQLSISSASTNYTIDFDNSVSGVNNGQFNGTGFTSSPLAGQIDSDGLIATGLSDSPLFSFGESNTSGDFARGTSTGGVTTGGIYSFEVSSGNFSLGAQPTGSDFLPGSFVLKLTNNTGSPITSLVISYKIYEYNDQNRSSSFNFSYSSDNVSYTSVSSLDITSTEAEDLSPVWIAYNKNTTISGLNIANGSNYYFRWTSDDVGGSGSRDELAIDDIIINASVNSDPTIIVNPTSLTGFSYQVGNGPSDEQSFTVSGSNLSANISITPPANYEISTGTGGSFSAENPITLTQSGGTVIPTTIYVRLKAGLTTGDYNNENITASSTGATDKTITCSGSVTDLPNAWINEFHYDNDGDDEGEFVEIVIENPADFTVGDFRLDLYNGNGGSSYDNKTLDVFTAGVPFVVGGKTFNIYFYSYGDVIQNGSPDGLALSHNGNLIQFISYEGTLTASGGPANGMLSTDIEISESSSTPVGSSLGLTGAGTEYSDFTWTTFAVASAGSQNSSQALPVEISTFTASIVNNAIQLQWKTATEIDNYGFEIERTSPHPSPYQGEGGDEVGGRGWETIGFITGHGTSSSPKNYEFTDKSVIENGVYAYRLKQIDNNGTFEYSDIVEISFMKSFPSEFALEQNYPNPFNPVTHINFVIPNLSNPSPYQGEGKREGFFVLLSVYDILGNQVAVLVNEPKSPGIYEVDFDGSKFVSGIYFYQLSFDGLIVASKKMLLLK